MPTQNRLESLVGRIVADPALHARLLIEAVEAALYQNFLGALTRTLARHVAIAAVASA